MIPCTIQENIEMMIQEQAKAEETKAKILHGNVAPIGVKKRYFH
jgi:hypothetical protein